MPQAAKHQSIKASKRMAFTRKKFCGEIFDELFEEEGPAQLKQINWH